MSRTELSEIWYTRCPVATPLGLADRLGYLEEDFARDHGFLAADFEVAARADHRPYSSLSAKAA